MVANQVAVPRPIGLCKGYPPPHHVHQVVDMVDMSTMLTGEFTRPPEDVPAA
jgi:hypothetical protein